MNSQTTNTSETALNSGKTIFKKISLPVVITALGVLLWLLLIQTSLRSGMLWNVIEGRLEKHIAFTLQDQIFEASPDKGNIKTIIIGDGLFIESAKSALDDSKSIVFLTLPGFTLADVREAMLSAKALEAETVVMQNSPYMWTNFWFRRAAPNLELWNKSQETGSLFDKKNINLAFNMLRRGADGVGNANLDKFDKRPANMYSVRWSEKPRGANGWDRYVKRTSPNGPESVIWVTDKRQLAENIDPTIIETFDGRFRRGFISDFGWVVDDFNQINSSILIARAKSNK